MATDTNLIEQSPGVCGGAPRIRGTRIPVWGLVERRCSGLSDEEILSRLPGLKPEALAAAWAYADQHPAAIDRSLWENRACMMDHQGSVPAWFLVRGRQLGLSEEQIRRAFEPPLAQEVLNRAWVEYAVHEEKMGNRQLHQGQSAIAMPG